MAVSIPEEWTPGIGTYCRNRKRADPPRTPVLLLFVSFQLQLPFLLWYKWNCGKDTLPVLEAWSLESNSFSLVRTTGWTHIVLPWFFSFSVAMKPWEQLLVASFQSSKTAFLLTLKMTDLVLFGNHPAWTMDGQWSADFFYCPLERSLEDLPVLFCFSWVLRSKITTVLKMIVKGWGGWKKKKDLRVVS